MMLILFDYCFLHLYVRSVDMEVICGLMMFGAANEKFSVLHYCENQPNILPVYRLLSFSILYKHKW